MVERVLRLTTAEAAAAIRRQFGYEIPTWRMRRVIDAMEREDRLEVQRMGGYRTVSDGQLGEIVAELKRLGVVASVSTCK